MGVLDGQPVNQAITNPSFINKNVDDVMPNQLGFNRPMSGPDIADIQQAVNNIYDATGVSEIANGTDYNATPSTIDNGDSHLVALRKLANKFDPATGHVHSGSAGDAPPISGDAIANVPLASLISTGATIFSVTGSSRDVTSELSGKSESTAVDVPGIPTATGNNYALLLTHTTQRPIFDSGNNPIYGRVTHPGTAWLLSFYSLIAGVETVYSIPATGALNLDWYYQELFEPLVTTPVYQPTVPLLIETIGGMGDGASGTTFKDSEFEVYNASDSTKKFHVNLATQSAGFTTTLRSNQSFNSATFDFPNVGSATGNVIVTENDSATLTNKTIDPVRTTVNTDSTTTGSAATISSVSAGVLRLTNASLVSLAGINAGLSGQYLVLENKTGASISILNDDAGASAGNKIYTGTGSSVTVINNASVELIYDSTSSHWMLIGISSSGSSFGKNYITNGTAEVDTSGWATYADAAQNIPVDGTGGTATGLTFSRSTSSPLDGTASFLMAQANSTSLQGKGVSYDFTIDSADKAKMLSISFNYNASSTFVAADGITAPLNDGTTTTNVGNSDIEVFVYDVTNSLLVYVSPEVISANGSNNFTFKGQFQTASNSTSYRLILHVATTSSNATGWNFKFDEVVVGPQTQLLGPPITDEASNTSLSASAGFGTVSLASYWMRRVGDKAHFRGYFKSGTVAASTAFLTLPSGMTIDTNKFSSTSNAQRVGIGKRIVTSGSAESNTGIFDLFYDGSTNNEVFISEQTQSNAFNKRNGNSSFSTNDGFTFEFQVPITGWSSTTTMSNDTDTRVVAAHYQMSSPATSSLTDNTYARLDFDNKIFDTHAAVTTGVTWMFTAPVSGFYKYSASFAVSGSAITYQRFFIRVSKAGNVFAEHPCGGAPSTSSSVGGTASGNVSLTAGQTLTFDGLQQSGGTRTLTTGSLSSVSIERISGPATIAASESVNARYFASATSISGSLATISWTTKDYDSHNGMSSGTYSVPISGKYQINSAVALSGTFALNNLSVIEIQKNGSVVSRAKVYAPSAVTQILLQIHDEIGCVAGDTIRIQVSSAGTGPAVVSSNFENYISLARVGN